MNKLNKIEEISSRLLAAMYTNPIYNKATTSQMVEEALSGTVKLLEAIEKKGGVK